MTLHVDPTARTPEDRSTEFVPVQGGTEGTSAEALLVAAYVVMWAVLMGFLLMTWRRQSRMEARLAALRSSLDRAAEKS